MPEQAQPSRPASTLHPLLLVGILAVLLRLFYFQGHLLSPLSTVPVLDAKHYDGVARAILQGKGGEALADGFRPVLYPLFLAAIYKIAGTWDIIAAMAAQHFLGIWTALLVAATARRTFASPLAGLAAGLLYALAGPPLYFEGELLITSLFTFLVTLILWVLVRQEDSRSLAGWLIAGCLIALAAEARSNLLIFLPSLLLFPLFLKLPLPTQRQTPRPALGAGLALGATLGGMLLLATAKMPWSGELRLLPGAGGINLYLGNRAGADGMIPRQDRAITYGEEYRDSVQVFAEEVYREAIAKEVITEARKPGAKVDPSAISRYWTGRTLEEIRHEPLAWLALMSRKVLFLTWNEEIPNNKSYTFAAARESPLLKYLPVRWWLLLTLAPAGLWLGLRRGSHQAIYWLSSFVILYGAGLLAFFVNSRFRIPLWPPLAILAGGGLYALVTGLRRRSLTWGLLACMALAASISIPNWAGANLPGPARDLFFRSIAGLERGDAKAALVDIQESLALDPEDPAAHYQLGASLQRLGRPREAAESYGQSILLHPGEPRAFNALGTVVESMDQPAEAYTYYLQALKLAPSYLPALVNASLLELRAGLTTLAEEKIDLAEALGGNSVQLLCARGVLEEAKGNQMSAREILAKANNKNPAATQALLKQHQDKVASETLLTAQTPKYVP